MFPTVQVLYDYDMFDRKVGETVVSYTSGVQSGSATTEFVSDGDDVLAELNSSGAVTQTNLWDAESGQLLTSDLGSGTSAITV